MSDYIDLKVVGQVIATGLVLGAGLPLVFALGLRAISAGTATAGATTGDVESASFQATRNPAALVLGVVCFLVVLAAIVLGIYTIVNKS